MSDTTSGPDNGQETTTDYGFTADQAIERLKTDKVYAQAVITAANQTDMGKEFLNNYHTTMSATALDKARKEAHGKGTGEAYGSVDKVLQQLVGSEKPDGMLTTDWLKQAFDSKAPDGSEEALQVLKDQLAASVDKINQYQQREQDITNEHKAQIRELTVGNRVSVGFSSLSFDSQVNEQLLSSVKGSVMAALVQNAKVDDSGNIVFYGSDGKPILNAQQSPATAAEAAKAILEPMGVLSKPKGGNADPAKIANTNGLSLQGVKTKSAALNALSASLTASKVKPNTKQWNDAFEALKLSDKYQALEG